MFHTHASRHGRAHWHGCGAAWKNAGYGHRFGGSDRAFGAQHRSAAVNIRETPDYYELFLFAPGLNKDAFSLSVSDDVLTIQVRGGQEDSNWLHHEYKPGGFERRFQLNQKVETDHIAARYADGVLEVTLPKAPGAAAQHIAVA